MHRPTDQPPPSSSDASNYRTTDSTIQRPTDPATHRYLERLTADQQVPGSNPGVPLLRENVRNHRRPTYDIFGYAFPEISLSLRDMSTSLRIRMVVRSPVAACVEFARNYPSTVSGVVCMRLHAMWFLRREAKMRCSQPCADWRVSAASGGRGIS